MGIRFRRLHEEVAVASSQGNLKAWRKMRHRVSQTGGAFAILTVDTSITFILIYGRTIVKKFASTQKAAS